MKRISQKLKGQGGASIAIAMIFFLFCIMICSVVLTAATGSAGRFRDMRTEEQAYLTSSSAATLLRDGLEGYAFEASRATLTRPDRAQALGTTYSEGEKGLAEWLRLSAQTVYDHGLTSTQEVEFQVQGMETAYAELHMAADYHVTATVYLKTEDDGRKNLVELRLPAVVEYSRSSEVPEDAKDAVEEGETRIEREVTSVSWPEGTLQRGGSA